MNRTQALRPLRLEGSPARMTGTGYTVSLPGIVSRLSGLVVNP